ncbi:MAG: response regulator [Candidatus Micrarchaeota archaeon]|nr:response regulator [Candidatus Micrarchaeota archaeon]
MIRVLVIDDDEFERDIPKEAIKKILGNTPHEIVEADDGKPGIAEYKKAKQSGRPFDLVTIDFTMPYGGPKVLEQIRCVLSDAKVPVVILSSCSNEGELRSRSECVKSNKPTAVLNKNDEAWFGEGPEKFRAILLAIAKKKGATSVARGGLGRGTRHEKSHYRLQNWRSAFDLPAGNRTEAGNRSNYNTSKRSRSAKPRGFG